MGNLEVSENSEYNFGFFVILFIILGYFQLFQLVIFPREIHVLSRFAAVLIVMLFVFLKFIYQKPNEIPKNFTLPINLILLSAFLSPITAASYHNQPYFLSIWVSISIFFYLFYYLLHSVRIEKETLEKIIIGIGLAVILMFYLQYFIYPSRIFGDAVRMSLDRGTVRLFIPGTSFVIVAYFYYLNKYFKNSNIIFVVIAMVAFSIFILQATRQIIATLALLTIIYIFRSKEVKSRFLLFSLIGIGLVALFYTFYDLFMEMYLVSQDQAGASEENIRIRAARHFLTEFMPNNLAYILGNADAHERSIYGIKVLKLKLSHGFYLSDVGLIGDYVKYGAFFLLGVIIMIIKLIRIKVRSEYNYLKYYIFFLIMTLVTGAGAFGSPNILIILIAYLFDLGRHEHQIAKSPQISHET